MNEANELDYAAIFEESTADVSNDGSSTEEQTETSESGAEIDDNGAVVEDTGDDAGTIDEGNDDGSAARAETDERPVQTPEENARYAAARRDAERQRDEAIAAERARHEQEVDNLFAQIGLHNPYTNSPIRSLEEYQAYRKQHDQTKKAEFLQATGMNEQQYGEFIANLPEVREARAAMEMARNAERQAADAKSRNVVDEQVRQITAYDDNIKSMSDLTKDASYPKVYELVKKGYSLVDAYKLANFEKLTGKASEAARQRVINEQAGKEHLVQTSQRGTGIDMVPADVKEQYRMMMPELSDAEIAKEYARHINQTRKK
jgi:hypothetical protein